MPWFSRSSELRTPLLPRKSAALPQDPLAVRLRYLEGCCAKANDRFDRHATEEGTRQKRLAEISQLLSQQPGELETAALQHEKQQLTEASQKCKEQDAESAILYAMAQESIQELRISLAEKGQGQGSSSRRTTKDSDDFTITMVDVGAPQLL